eukprot:2331058-Rhodomonas_salina.1
MELCVVCDAEVSPVDPSPVASAAATLPFHELNASACAPSQHVSSLTQLAVPMLLNCTQPPAALGLHWRWRRWAGRGPRRTARPAATPPPPTPPVQRPPHVSARLRSRTPDIPSTAGRCCPMRAGRRDEGQEGGGRDRGDALGLHGLDLDLGRLVHVLDRALCTQTHTHHIVSASPHRVHSNSHSAARHPTAKENAQKGPPPLQPRIRLASLAPLAAHLRCSQSLLRRSSVSLFEAQRASVPSTAWQETPRNK